MVNGALTIGIARIRLLTYQHRDRQWRIRTRFDARMADTRSISQLEAVDRLRGLQGARLRWFVLRKARPRHCDQWGTTGPRIGPSLDPIKTA
jgi:hypothetical protein